jgi:hypothetical protein
MMMVMMMVMVTVVTTNIRGKEGIVTGTSGQAFGVHRSTLDLLIMCVLVGPTYWRR